MTSRSVPRRRAGIALAALLAPMLALGGVAPTAQAADPPVTGTTPAITGKVQYGETVTAEPGDWQPAPVTLSYQWFSGSTSIPGATEKSFTIPIDMVSLRLSVVVTGAKDGHAPTSLRSASILVKERPFDTMGAVTFTGGTQIGDELTAMTVEHGWQPQPSSIKYTWYSGPLSGGGSPIAFGPTYRISAADVGKRIMVVARGELTGYSGERWSNNSVVIPDWFATAPDPTVAVADGGAARVGTQLLGAAGAWDPAPAALAYQWLRDGEPIAGATSENYTPAAADLCWELTLRVTASRPDRQRTVKTSAPQLIRHANGDACAQTMTPGVPAITGKAEVGQTLTALPGTWSPATVTFAYQWYRNGAAIPGATSSSYVSTPEDFLKKLSVRVAAEKPGWKSASAVSAEADVWAGQLTAPQYRLDGSAEVGAEMSAYDFAGDWAPQPVNVNYRWFYDGKPVPGSDSASHVVRAEGLGKTISVEVIGSKVGYDWKTITLTGEVVQPSSQPLEAFIAAPAPTVTGALRVGSKLETVPMGWRPGPAAFAYQWLRGGKPITGAHAAEYTLTSADAGARLSVRVTAFRARYQETTRTSAELPIPSLVKRLSATPRPRIAVVGGGRAKAGKKLAAKAGSWKPYKVTLSYRWLRNGKAIKGATKSRYKLTRKDRGKRISVRVTGKKPGYVTVSKTSSAKRVARTR